MASPKKSPAKKSSQGRTQPVIHKPSSARASSAGAGNTSTAKKRKRTTKKVTKAPSCASRSASSSTPNKKIRSNNSNKKTQVPPPTRILVVDNGGDTIKYGWNTEKEPRRMANVTARLQQQWTVLVGDQLSQIQNPNQLVGVVRSMERGMIVNFGNQVQVWKRMLDLAGVVVPTNSETAQAFGWKATRSSSLPVADSSEAQAQPSSTTRVPAHSCAVLLTLPPHCPRVILDQIVWIWMEDFGFSHVGLCLGPVCAATQLEHADYHTCCLVDLGWSATHIVPTYKGKLIQPSAIRRMSLAGRHLINMWKYYISYRQWNLMDQEWILRDVLHKTGYISLKFMEDMSLARKLPAGRRHFDREFLLPDFQHTFHGRVQLPAALRARESDKQEDEEDDEEDDEDVNENDFENDDDEDDDEDNQEDEEDGDSDAEESRDAIRKRLLKQRQEEEQCRRQLEQEQQVLNITVERFAVPEALFRPSDAGLPPDWAGLPAAILQSIDACPKHFQVALYQSVHLVGGLSQLPNLKERLQRELRALAPCRFEVKTVVSETPEDETWKGACEFSRQSYTKWSISKHHWESSAKRGAWKCLLAPQGGLV